MFGFNRVHGSHARSDSDLREVCVYGIPSRGFQAAVKFLSGWFNGQRHEDIECVRMCAKLNVCEAKIII